MTDLPRCAFSDLPRLMCSCPDCDHFTMTDAEMAARRPGSAPRRPPERRTQLASLPEYSGRLYGRPADVQPAQGGNPCRTCDKLAGDAFLCPACLDDVERILGDVPAMVEDLEVAMQRRVRFTLNPGSAGDDTPIPADLRAGHLLAQLRNELAGAVRILCENRGQQVDVEDTMEAMSRWLLRYSSSIALDVAGEDIYRGLKRVHKSITQHIDRPPPKVYLGLCPACRTAVFAEHGETEGHCGIATCLYHVVPIVVEDARDQLTSRIRHVLATVGELERLSRTARQPVKHRRITYLIERGMLHQRGTRDGHATYRVGDLLALTEDDDKEASVGA